MGVPREILDQIRHALNPLDIVREAVPSLKQSGQRWRGNCPFHNERTPSFFFMPDKGLWHCFGACQEGGDVFKFVMRLENLSFPEALRQLAKRAGVSVEWRRADEASSRAMQEREKLLGLLEEAAGFYHKALQSQAEADPARRHLASRKIRGETVEKFQLGYSSARNGFLDSALHRGVPIELLLKTGLAARSEKTGRYHDPLFGRLTFPIYDPYGQVVGFGGRVLAEDASGPKYLNSPETPVYTKGRQLYGLYQARSALRERGQAFLVEGYMDVIGCHQAGLACAVAPLGTAFTREQGTLLKRYVQETVLLYDPDEAGDRASWRSAEMLLQADLFVRIAHVPDGKDPDEYVLAKGPGALEEAVRQAKDVVDYWLDRSADRAPSGLQERIRLAQELLDFLRSVPNEMLRQEWLRKTARRLMLDERSLMKEFQKRSPADRTSGPAKPAGTEATKTGAPESKPAFKVRSAEEELLQVLCAHTELWPTAVFPDILLSDLRCLAAFKKLQGQWNASQTLDVAGLLAELNPEDGNWLTALLAEEKTFDDPEETLANGIKRLESQAMRREHEVLKGQVLQMMEGRLPKDESKIVRFQTLTRIIKGTSQGQSQVS
ncbi:MAG: DNA primase [Elusimicrobia bacterium]|nr:DNA primase [Elusimicrobiota bacterium]